MVQDAVSEFHRRRALMGIPATAGMGGMPSGGFNADTGHYDRRALVDRFAPILGGALKPKINEFDVQESSLFSPPTRLNPNGENGDGGRTAAAITPSMGMGLPRNDRRNQRARGPQQQKQKVSTDFIVPVADPTAGTGGFNHGAEKSELAQLNAMWEGGHSSSSGGYRPSGALMPERGRNTALSLGDDYMASAPFNPMNQIMNRVAARGGDVPVVDYREIESRRAPVAEQYDTDDRYLSNTQGRGTHQDPQLIQEMALNMATEMFKTMMSEQKGKKYYKEVRTKHVFDNPASKLVEMDGQFYRMDLKPVKLKYPKVAKRSFS